MKSKTNLFPVNLQEGFILLDNTIIGVYSHHNKVCVFREPYYFVCTLIMPNDVSSYKQIFGFTDSFSIRCWTNNGYKTIYDINKLEQAL